MSVSRVRLDGAQQDKRPEWIPASCQVNSVELCNVWSEPDLASFINKKQNLEFISIKSVTL